MKILFLSRLYRPHVGGVEKHLEEVSQILEKKGHRVTIVTEKYSNTLEDSEVVNGTRVIRFSYPHVKFLGLIFIWWWLFVNRAIIQTSDIVHTHDCFIWYWPFRIFYPNKRVVSTIHGLEWDRPLSKFSLIQKKIAIRFSTKSVGVGRFLEKYLKMRFNLVIYGGIKNACSYKFKKRKNIVYVGRLENNTGLFKFITWLKFHPEYSVRFCGDGELRSKCLEVGQVMGFVDPTPFLKQAEYCVPGGYLAALEALSYNCKLKLFWNNKVKEDYWKMSPFVKKDVKKWARKQTWEKLANEYLNLYNNI